jgi:para-nitrobenzyl esterase
MAALILIGGPFAANAAKANGGLALALTRQGLFIGTKDDSLREFLGIPYAAPPVGENRWRPPQPLDPRPRIHLAREFANHCPQGATPFGLASDTEDCLYLNVYTPNDRFGHHARRSRGLKPVMVWIHGGALFLGESDDYDPRKLVEDGDVVVVTINYRLGALGFLSHPALTAESSNSASGNYGLLDQQAALHWVQDNIKGFGGDPHNVTIFGESAGGLSVHSQLASPLAAGLFDRAIVESGAYSLDQPSLPQAEALGSAYAAAVGCPDQTAECLRAVPVEVLLANQGGGGYVPTVDNYVLTQSVGTALATGNFNQVPVIEGSNHDEWRLFVALNNELVSGPITPAGYPAAIAGLLGIPEAFTAPFVSTYPLSDYDSPGEALGALGTDGFFACTARAAAGLLSQHVDTYAYEFNDENAPQLFLPPVSFPLGAYHASELQYLFGVRPAVTPAPFTPEQEALSDTMVRYWTRFAHTGNPNAPDVPVWTPEDGVTDEVQSLDTPASGVIAGFAVDHKCGFWSSL